MSIIINRNTGWNAWFLGIQIIVNGEKVNTIEENKSMEIDLDNQKALLKVQQFGIESKEIEVKDGDVLEIKSSWWYRRVIPIMIIIQIVSFSFTNLENRLASLMYITMSIIILSVIIFSLIFLNGFKIETLDRNKE